METAGDKSESSFSIAMISGTNRRKLPLYAQAGPADGNLQTNLFDLEWAD
jgi:hypothetical protein